MINRIIAAALVSALFFVLAGCMRVLPHNDPANPDNQPGGWFGVAHVNVDGRSVPCVTWKMANAGGVSCDWGSK